MDRQTPVNMYWITLPLLTHMGPDPLPSGHQAVWREADGTHPIRMHSCLNCKSLK